MDEALQHLLSTIAQMRKEEEAREKEEDVIKVSAPVTAAASVYETVRNTLEYDEEHLLRRNAIRRILKRKIFEVPDGSMAEKLIKELIWARYLENGGIPTRMIQIVAQVLDKYKPLFETLDAQAAEDKEAYEWLLDVMSVEIEYILANPCVDEALASFAYQELKKRIDWETNSLSEQARDLQLYIAVHRTMLKSNTATLRYRLLTLYYNHWRKASPDAPVVTEIAQNLDTVIESVEKQIHHPAGDEIYRFVRRHAFVFRLITDVAKDNPEAFASAVMSADASVIQSAITKAAESRYRNFKTKLRRTVIRAAFFLLLTKSILALLVELPYEIFILKVHDFMPLIVNIVVPPLVLMAIGLSARIPKKENTKKTIEEVLAVLGAGEDFRVTFKRKRGWGRGTMWWIFNGLYAFMLLISIVFMSVILAAFQFNGLSIFFFIFFLSIVAYFGIRIRNTRRDLIVINLSRGLMGSIFDFVFLPMVRAGRWVSVRAPKVNIFLFFFDFIIEAPFKAAIDIIESWMVFMKEKREEL